VEQVKQELQASGSRKLRVALRARRYSNCNATGHNVRTCQIIIEVSEEEDSK
jgi:hypothetical protein